MAVAFAAVGTSGFAINGFSNTVTATGSHTATAGDIVLLGYSAKVSEARSAQTRTVTYGGVAMNLLGFIEYSANVAFCELWWGVGVAGAQTTSVAVTGATNTGRATMLNSVSYSGVGSLSTVTTGSGTGTAEALASVPSATGDVVVGFFGTSQSVQSAFTPTSRYTGNSSDGFADIALGEGTGAATVSFAATGGTSIAWGAIAVRLQPPRGFGF